jgi:hypothetical protein
MYANTATPTATMMIIMADVLVARISPFSELGADDEDFLAGDEVSLDDIFATVVALLLLLAIGPDN